MALPSGSFVYLLSDFERASIFTIRKLTGLPAASCDSMRPTHTYTYTRRYVLSFVSYVAYAGTVVGSGAMECIDLLKFPYPSPTSDPLSLSLTHTQRRTSHAQLNSLAERATRTLTTTAHAVMKLMVHSKCYTPLQHTIRRHGGTFGDVARVGESNLQRREPRALFA